MEQTESLRLGRDRVGLVRLDLALARCVSRADYTLACVMLTLVKDCSHFVEAVFLLPNHVSGLEHELID